MRGINAYSARGICMKTEIRVQTSSRHPYQNSHPPDTNIKIQDTFLALPRQPSYTLHTLPRNHRLPVEYIPQGKSIWWVGGWFLQEILPLRGSILQVGTCQILSWAENPRWNRVWQQTVYCFTNILSQKIEEKHPEVPPFGPLKIKANQKRPSMTAYNPQFLIQNPILQ